MSSNPGGPKRAFINGDSEWVRSPILPQETRTMFVDKITRHIEKYTAIDTRLRNAGWNSADHSGPTTYNEVAAAFAAWKADEDWKPQDGFTLPDESDLLTYRWVEFLAAVYGSWTSYKTDGEIPEGGAFLQSRCAWLAGNLFLQRIMAFKICYQLHQMTSFGQHGGRPRNDPEAAPL
jgi:hypothetical protein